MRLVERRIGLLFAVFLCLLGIVALRSFWLATVQAGPLKERAATQQVEDLTVSAHRGTITDRHGVELAVSEEALTVFANPMLIERPQAVAAKLAPLLGRPEDELLEKLSDRSRGFVYLVRKLDANKGEKVKALEIEGIDTVAEPTRTYPQGALASQLIGAVGTDNYGLSGLEQSQEATLHGTDGKRRLVKDALGEPISLIEEERAEPGEDIRLTIDAAIQERVEAVLGEVGTAFQPRGATALVMDPRTGELLALANWPRVDPEEVGNAHAYARQNRAVAASYEPGSTFKAFTVAGAMEEKLIEPKTEMSLPPTIQVADRVIKEAHDRGGITLTVSDILAQSSNVGSVMIGLKLGAYLVTGSVGLFSGFGSGTGVDLPAEQMGIVPHPKDYSGSSMGNLPIGQGLAVTPIQMAAAYSAIADHGLMHPPYVIAGQRRKPRRVLSRETADSVSKMLEGVLAIGGNSKTKFVASFIGYAPARNPRLLVAVMVDEPKGQIYGGVVAAPAFERIVEFALPYLRIPPR